MMADTSPGKVQALRAMFSQNDPVVGLLPMNNKMGVRPWKRNMEAENQISETIEEKPRISPTVNSCANRTILKSLQASDLETVPKKGDNVHDILPKVPPKPIIGPKPVFLKSLVQASTLTVTQSLVNDSKPTSDKFKSSFFIDSPSALEKDKQACDRLVRSSPLPSNVTFRTSDKLLEQMTRNVFPNSDKNKNIDMYSKMNIGSDNYVCKSNYKPQMRQLPPVQRIGPPPSKPLRPSHLKINTSVLITSSQSSKKVAFSEIHRFAFGDTQEISKPPSSCLPKPPSGIPSHLRSSASSTSSCSSSSSSIISSEVFDDKLKGRTKSLLQEIEELYGDTILDDELIPEYTAEEEAREQEELYIDAGDQITCSMDISTFQKPKHPPPPPPFSYLESSTSNFFPDELYQDATEVDQEEFYEEMPCEQAQDDHYSNSSKEREKMRREDEKRIRRESKEKEKRERELERLKKKFGISGNETAIYSGLVKADSRGGRNDLNVKKGEIVHILRIEGNPPGKWLAKNKKGKCGYVELTRIEVDPDTVKSVMSFCRTITSASEELYSEAYSEQDEGIYEMTY